MCGVRFAGGFGRFNLSPLIEDDPTHWLKISVCGGVGFDPPVPLKQHQHYIQVTSRSRYFSFHSRFERPNSLLHFFARNEAVVWLIKGSSCLTWRRELRSWFQRQGEAYRKQRSVVRNEDDVGGRARVTRDEERVLRGGWTEMRLCKYGGSVVVRTL